MKRHHLLLALTLLACGSGPDPSATGGDVASVEVSEVSTGAFIGSAVLDAQGDVIVTSEETLEAVRFDPGVVLPSTWEAPASQPEVELAAAGANLFWAANDGSKGSLWTAKQSNFLSPLEAATAFPCPFGSDVVGLVADTNAVYAAVSTPRPNAPLSGPSPDSWQWPTSPAVDTPTGGAVYRIVPGASGTIEALPATTTITFYPAFMQHVLAQSSTEVFWVNSTSPGPQIGSVMAATKTAWTNQAPRVVAKETTTGGNAVGFVGLAANDTAVAWAITSEPYPGSTGCWIGASLGGKPATMILDSTLLHPGFLCDGLAVDAQYAYFATVEVYVPPAGASSSVLRGTGIARVPLAGGAIQTVPLKTDRWYGARRVLVDDTYVYAIDPSFVVRFPKSDFGS
jgi:hypothetical protein